MGPSVEEMEELLKEAGIRTPADGKRRNQHTKPNATPGMKICCRCEEEKPLGEYTKNRAKADGLDARCRACKKEIREGCIDYNKAKSKEWREANPERFKEKRDAWMQAHPQSENPTRQEWMRKNVAKVRQIKKTYKVRRMGWEVGEVDYLEVLMRDGFVCHICGNDVEPDDVHFDHAIPLSKGGAHATYNVFVSHSRCNMKKSNKLIEKVTATMKAG
jgi:5-methylcytosine-specific restriction endonuclease McrA